MSVVNAVSVVNAATDAAASAPPALPARRSKASRRNPASSNRCWLRMPTCSIPTARTTCRQPNPMMRIEPTPKAGAAADAVAGAAAGVIAMVKPKPA